MPAPYPTPRIAPSLRLVRVSTKIRLLPETTTPTALPRIDLLIAPLFRGTRGRAQKAPAH